jgi:hypothetical protein
MKTKSFTTLVPCFLLAGLVGVTAMGAGCTIQTVDNPADGGTPPTADGGPSSTSDSGATAADGGGAVAPVQAGCGYGEPNETREQSKVIEPNVELKELCLKAADNDFFEFTAPNDPAGGYVIIEALNVGDGWIESEVFAVENNGSIISTHAPDRTASLKQYVNVAPGKKYRIRMGTYVGASETEYKYDLKVRYTKIDDTYEPNDTREAAKPITKGTPVSGYATAGYVTSEIADGAFDDWYSLDLAAGSATVKLDDVASNFWARVRILDASGNEVVSQQGSDRGANITKEATELVAGKHYVVVGVYVGAPDSAKEGDIPQSISRPYKLTVTQ